MMKFSQMINEEQSSRFKVSLDLHGVIDVMPEFFSFLSNAIVEAGGEVHVVTGGTLSDKLEEKIKTFGIRYTHIFSVYQYLLDSGAPSSGTIQFPDGSIQKKFEGNVWDTVKGDYCRKNNITLHIDDTMIYNDFFTTPFARFWSHNNMPKSSHREIRHMD